MELTDRELPLPHLPIRMMHQNRAQVNKLATDNGRTNSKQDFSG